MDRPASPALSGAPDGTPSSPTDRPALRIALWFALFGAIWIVASDRLLMSWTRDPDVLGRMQTAKGWLFVGVSAVLVYLLASRAALFSRSEHERIRRERERLEVAQRLAGLGHWTLDLETQRLHGSREFFRLLGLNGTDRGVELDEVLDVIHPADRERIAALHTHRRDGEGDGDAFHRVLTSDGDIRWIHERAHTERAPDGTPLRLVGTAQDITELRRAEREARETRDRLEAVLRASPVAIVVLDAEARLLRWNPAAESIFGWTEPEVLGGPLPFVPDERSGEFAALFRRVLEGETLRAHVVRRVRKDGSPVDLSLSTSPLRDAGGRIVGTVGLMEDVTERIRASRQLEETSRLLERTFESLGEAVFVLRDRRIVECNPAAETIFGHSREALVGASTEFLHVDRKGFVDFALTGDGRLLEEGGFTAEHTMRRADGTTFPSEHTVTLLDPDRGLAGGVVSVVRDISERRKAAAERERFYERLHLTREQERKRLSREVHDELGQTLTGLKMDLARLKTRGECAEVRPQLDELDALVDQAIRDVRRIATELRPGVLDDLGLVAALEWLCEEVSHRGELEVECRCELDRVELDDGRATQVFRIAQEALTNVLRHAEASRAGIDVAVDEDVLTMVVWDDGRGLARPPDRNRAGLGLVGMRERATMIAGKLHLESPPRGGTRVVLRLPLDRRGAPRQETTDR